MKTDKLTVPVEVKFGDLEKLAAISALNAEAEAIRAEVLGMRFENEFDPSAGHYNDEAFFNAANELRSIAEKLRELTEVEGEDGPKEAKPDEVWLVVINGARRIVYIDSVDNDFGYLFASFDTPLHHWSKKDCDSFELVHQVTWQE